MKDSILTKIKELSEKAKLKGAKASHITVVSSANGTALSNTIKTKEDAELFMKRLKALHE